MLVQLSFIEWIIVLSLSAFFPFAIFFGKGNIRSRRLENLDNLERTLFNTQTERGPSQRYLDVARARYNQDIPETQSIVLNSYVIYTLPTGIFILFSAIGFFLVMSIINYGFSDPNLLMSGLFNDPNSIIAYRAATALIVSGAFLGSYIWSVNYLIMRVANFDLTPLDFLRASAHILLTVLIAGILRHVIAAGTEAAFTLGIVLLIAFLTGLFPALGINTLIDRLPANFKMKRVVAEVPEISRDLPLDLIDGIDSGIKFRLANYEVNDVQNLATQNPISLYISTPYNLLEILDWIAQAQLIIEIGPKGVIKARQKSVRDIVSFLDMSDDAAGRVLLGSFMSDEKLADEVVETRIDSLKQTPYVIMLLDLWKVLSCKSQETCDSVRITPDVFTANGQKQSFSIAVARPVQACSVRLFLNGESVDATELNQQISTTIRGNFLIPAEFPAGRYELHIRNDGEDSLVKGVAKISA